jgi:hypothetical protein
MVGSLPRLSFSSTKTNGSELGSSSYVSFFSNLEVQDSKSRLYSVRLLTSIMRCYRRRNSA